MYEAQPIMHDEGQRITPKVFLLSATPDPLGVLAIDMRMYRGDPVYSASEITDEERKWAWDELSRTRLNTPLEGVQMKFMIEAVTRSFTHQMVRQRVGAYYVQESLRFAVKKGLANETALPPSIARTDEGPGKIWQDTVQTIEAAYEGLVNAGIPAEDARGLLPHAVTTRLLYTTNLRALFEHAGNRLCTQAQFEWRAVFMGIMKAMREHGRAQPKHTPMRTYFPNGLEGPEYYNVRDWQSDGWQWEIIAQPTPKTFAPVCYKTGKCEFMASLDRGCSIRDRVQAFHEHGVPPEMWGDGYVNWAKPMAPIDPAEWMANPLAGVTTETNRPQ
jgi:flavin-dependent thymidylate synthase